MRARRIDERGDNWEGRCPQRPRASRLILRAVSGEKLVSRITSRTFLCGGRGVLLRPFQLFFRTLHSRVFLRALSYAVAGACCCSPSSYFFALCIVAYSFAHSLMRRTAPEGRGPPSYFPRNTLARISDSLLFFAHLQIANLTSICCHPLIRLL